MHRACSVKSLWQREFGGKHPFLAGIAKSTLTMALGSLLLSWTAQSDAAPAALQDRTVKKLYSTPSLWVGSTTMWDDTMVSTTLTEGLLLTQIATGKTAPFPGTENTALASATISRSLSRNYQTGELWVGTVKEGLWHYQQGVWSNHRLLNSVLNITQTAADGSGKAWVIAGYRELHHFDGAHWQSFDNALTRMAQDSAESQLRFYTNTTGAVWLTLTTNYQTSLPRSFYIMRLGTEQGVIDSMSGPNLIRVAIDEGGTPWILHRYGSSSTGVVPSPYLISTVRADTLCPVVLTNTSNQGALDILVNKTELYLWSFNGLLRLEDTVVTRVAPPFNGKTFSYPEGWHFDARTDSVLVFDSPTGGAPMFRRFSLTPDFTAKRWNDSTIVAWEDAPGSSQQCMVIDKKNIAWIGMGTGARIAYRDADSAFKGDYSNWGDLRFPSTLQNDERVTALAVGPDNTKWAVCGNTLYSFADTTGAATAHPAPNYLPLDTTPHSLVVDKNGTVWVAAQSDVYKTNLASFDGTTWNMYAIGDYKSSIWVLRMGANTLFALKANLEVAKISLDGKHTLYATHSGSPTPSSPQSINLLALNDTTVLIGTPKKLYRVNLNATTLDERSLTLPLNSIYGLFYPDFDTHNPISLLAAEGDSVVWLRERRFGMRAYRYRPGSAAQPGEVLELTPNEFEDPTTEQMRAIRDCAFSTSGILYVIPEAVQQEPQAVSTAPHAMLDQSLPNQGGAVKMHYQAGAISFALPAQSQAQLELFNLNGRLLLRTQLSNSTLQPAHQSVALTAANQSQLLLARMSVHSAAQSQPQITTARLPLTGR